jgi:trans-2,3-dihydro-3-hydroxyanthranilate isomerase
MGSIFGRDVPAAMRFEEDAGLVEVESLRCEGRVTGATIRAPQRAEVGEEIAATTIADCASVKSSDVVTKHHAPVFASVGLPFAFAELNSLETLARATPNVAAFRDAHQRHPNPIDRFSLFLYVRTGRGAVQARMFAPLSNIMEDPATGSASAALGGLLSSLERDDDGFQLTIAQGVEMGRPSVIEVKVSAAGGRQSIHVSGHCVPVMRGSFTVDRGKPAFDGRVTGVRGDGAGGGPRRRRFVRSLSGALYGAEGRGRRLHAVARVADRDR